MHRKAFLLGLFSIGGQVLIIRECLGTFYGSELFIGIALFGWLISVALGAWLGGKLRTQLKSIYLFIAGAVILPALIIYVRTLPIDLGVTDYVRPTLIESSIFAILLTILPGAISGALFSAINNEGYRPAKSIGMVYLFEGIGAFVGGIIMTALTGPLLGNPGMALALSFTTLMLYFIRGNRLKSIIFILFLTAGLVTLVLNSSKLEKSLESIRHSSYQVLDSFDTPYGHHAILDSDGYIMLYTNNSYELSYPEMHSAEFLMIPPLALKPDARNVLIVGRTEFGIDSLIKKYDGLTVTAVDPRKTLNDRLDRAILRSPGVIRISDDPLSYLRKHSTITPYDIIIVAPKEPANLLATRYYTGRFLASCRSALADDGLLVIITGLDTDRYVSEEKAKLLSIMYNTIHQWFDYIDIWPGNSTIMMASGTNLFDIYNSEIFNRIDSLPFTAEYFNRYYYSDALKEENRARVFDAVDTTAPVNSVNKPVLLHYGAVFSSLTKGADESMLRQIFDRKIVLFGIPAVILLVFLLSLSRGYKHQKFGLFLYFTAGLVSLCLELLIVYLYQTLAGSIYSEIGILFGAFMLGLSCGTWYALKCNSENLEFPSLLLLGTIIFMFLWSYQSIPESILLGYFGLVLFTTGTAAGTLFIAATARYYFGRAGANRGTGYAVEILGSAIGALFTVAVFLPILGLTWILISLLIVTALALIGSYLTA